MPRSYSRSPSRTRKSDRTSKHSKQRRSRSKSKEYDKYHRKESDKSGGRIRSKSRSFAPSSSYRSDKKYRDRNCKETSRRPSSRDRHRRRKSRERARYRRSCSNSSSSSSTSCSSSSHSSGSDSSSSTSRKSTPTILPKESSEKVYVFKSLEDSRGDPVEKTTKLQQLNADDFIPQSFVSSRKPLETSTVSSNIVIDLASQTIKVPTVDKPVTDEDPIFHPMFFPGDDNQRMARWVKKLHTLRQTLG